MAVIDQAIEDMKSLFEALMRWEHFAIEYDILSLGRIEEPMPFAWLDFVRLLVLWAQYHRFGAVVADHAYVSSNRDEGLSVTIMAMQRHLLSECQLSILIQTTGY
jgi:hypothetical protein